MVTSSAVVGSSATRTAGRAIRAEAIITRWHMPPDSSNGYWSMRRPGSDMPTSRSMPAPPPAPRLQRGRLPPRPVAPTVHSGSSAACGSWKIIEIRCPRSLRIRRSGSAEISSPASVIRPPTCRTAPGSRRIAASAVSDLPQPDSPTSASTSAGCTAKPTSSTTATLSMASVSPATTSAGGLSATRAGAVNGRPNADRAGRAASRQAG